MTSKREELIEVIGNVELGIDIGQLDGTDSERIADALLERFEMMDKNDFCILRDHYGHDWHPTKKFCLVCGREREVEK